MLFQNDFLIMMKQIYRLLKNISLNPWQYLVISFVLLIGFGAVLLKMPFVQHQGGLSGIDAIFTSTSAVCVTGLTTVRTSGFNLWGQLSILLLIQLGAIGIMTLTTSFLLVLRGNVSLKQRLSFSQLQDNYDLLDATYVLKNIVKITFIIEFIGMILLSAGFLIQGLTLKNALYQGFFHSISAFCNAGFSTYDQSLIGTNALIKMTVSALIVMGGLGYFVIYEIMHHYKSKRPYSLHTKIVLRVSLFLIVVGTILLYFIEGQHISLVDSLFQSVTTRTAGFNSVDITQMSHVSIFIMILLMFIGASPGSTGGGIKTTNFFIMIFAIVSVLKGRRNFVIWHRTISSNYILKAFGTTISYFLILSIGITLLLFEPDLSFKDTLFEAVSAMGTVGLSMGITPHLTLLGKWVIIALMFIGRLGPASFAMASLQKQKNIRIKYPEAVIY